MAFELLEVFIVPKGKKFVQTWRKKMFRRIVALSLSLIAAFLLVGAQKSCSPTMSGTPELPTPYAPAVPVPEAEYPDQPPAGFTLAFYDMLKQFCPPVQYYSLTDLKEGFVIQCPNQLDSFNQQMVISGLVYMTTYQVATLYTAGSYVAPVAVYVSAGQVAGMAFLGQAVSTVAPVLPLIAISMVGMAEQVANPDMAIIQGATYRFAPSMATVLSGDTVYTDEVTVSNLISQYPAKQVNVTVDNQSHTLVMPSITVDQIMANMVLVNQAEIWMSVATAQAGSLLPELAPDDGQLAHAYESRKDAVRTYAAYLLAVHTADKIYCSTVTLRCAIVVFDPQMGLISVMFENVGTFSFPQFGQLVTVLFSTSPRHKVKLEQVRTSACLQWDVLLIPLGPSAAYWPEFEPMPDGFGTCLAKKNMWYEEWVMN